jgi:hypothetical protein
LCTPKSLQNAPPIEIPNNAILVLPENIPPIRNYFLQNKILKPWGMGDSPPLDEFFRLNAASADSERCGKYGDWVRCMEKLIDADHGAK